MLANYTELLIKSENQGGVLVTLIIDDHKSHLLGHLLYIWKPRILLHCLGHIRLWRRKSKMNLPTINLKDLIERDREK